MDDAPLDRLSTWRERYLQLAVTGVRSPAVTAKITLHLQRFTDFFTEHYGHDRIATCLRRDVLDWQRSLRDEQKFGPSHG